jgi:hypothetical protein
MYAGGAIKVDGFYGALANSTEQSHTIAINTFAFPAVPKESSGHIRFYANNPPEADSGNTMFPSVNVLIENNVSYRPPSNAGGSSPGPTMVAALYNGFMSYLVSQWCYELSSVVFRK